MNQQELNHSLINSADGGDLEGVIDALRQGADIHARDDLSLRWSARWGHLNVVKYLLQDAGANIHALNNQALRWSAEEGHLPVVRYLLEMADPPAKIHAKNDQALRFSARNNYWDVATYLVWKGADINILNRKQHNKVRTRLDDPDLIEDQQLRLDYKKAMGKLSLQEMVYLEAERTGQLKKGDYPQLDVSCPRSTSLKSRINHLLSYPMTQSERKLLINLL